MLPCFNFAERVYKYSKVLVWSMFFYITGRMGHFGGSHSRLCFMDTDSKHRSKRPYKTNTKRRRPCNFIFFSSTTGFFMSYQRERSDAEIEEVNDLLASGRRIPFYQSFTAERMTNHYLQTFGAILDWSSIGQVHPLFSKDKHGQNMHWALRLSFDNIDCTEPLRSSSLDAPSSRIRGST